MEKLLFQLQNFIILQTKVDILYLELVKTVYTKNPDLPHLGQCFYFNFLSILVTFIF